MPLSPSSLETPTHSRRRWLHYGVALAGAASLAACGSKQPWLSNSIGQKPLRQPKLGLALGGGAARGFAHIGVLEVLESAGIRPDLIVGTSAGSVVGAIYASGKRGQALREAASGLDQNSITDWQIPFFNRGVLRGNALERFINQQVGNQLLQNMPIPLGVVATNLQTGEGILFRSGNTGQAVRASSAVPGVFEPVRIGSQEFVDGGLVAPVPVNYARRMGADVVLAVDISSDPSAEAQQGQFQVLLKTFSIMGRSINSQELRSADVVVRPPLSGVSSTDLSNRDRAIAAGQQAMRAALPQLRAALQPR